MGKDRRDWSPRLVTIGGIEAMLRESLVPLLGLLATRISHRDLETRD